LKHWKRIKLDIKSYATNGWTLLMTAAEACNWKACNKVLRLWKQVLDPETYRNYVLHRVDKETALDIAKRQNPSSRKRGVRLLKVLNDAVESLLQPTAIANANTAQ